MEYSGAGGELIHEKNQKQKISWHCPFNESSSNFTLGYSCTNFHAFNYMQYFLSLDKFNSQVLL